MDEYKNILERLEANLFPEMVTSANYPLIQEFRDLYKAGHIEALEMTSLDGPAYIDSRITLSGKEFLAKLKESKNDAASAPIYIGHISGTNVQVGNKNSITINMTVTELVEQIAKNGDPEAKSMLKGFFNNATVASMLGAGASALVNLLN